MALVNVGTDLIWEQAQQATGLDPRLFTLLVCVIGGLLVGLLVKLFGDHNGIFAELMLEFGRTGRFDYRNAPGIVITAFVSLITGASLGPEAPLADACGGIGTLISDRLKLNEEETRTMGYSGLSGMLAAFITSPFSGALLGLAVNLMFPQVPVAVAVAATMAGALVASLRAPLFAALFTTTLVQKETSAVIAVAIVVGAILTALLALRTARRAAAHAEAPPAAA